MAPSTALFSSLAGMSLLLLAHGRGPPLGATGAGRAAGTLGLVGLLGYVYEVQRSTVRRLLEHGAAHGGRVQLLAVGLLFARPDGLAAVLMTPGPAPSLRGGCCRRRSWCRCSSAGCTCHGANGLFEPNVGAGLFLA